MWRTAKYGWQDYKTNEDTLSEVKINPVVKKIRDYRNKWVEHVQRMDRDRLPHVITKYQPCGETKPWKSPQKTSGLLVGPEQGTRPKPLQAI